MGCAPPLLTAPLLLVSEAVSSTASDRKLVLKMMSSATTCPMDPNTQLRFWGVFCEKITINHLLVKSATS